MMTEGLIWELLLRLPTKSLMRFKCVSKLWYSIICNPKFANVRCLHSFRGLLITNLRYTYFCSSPLPPRFFYANLNDCSPIWMSPQFAIQEQDYTNVTSVVKGLIGLYEYYNCFITLFNIATHQFLKLPPSPSPDLDNEYFYHYFLGFDPKDEVYKVLCLSLQYDRESNFYGEINSHVFALGVHKSDMEWRTIAPPPVDLVSPSQQCLCINGALYWLPYKGRNQETLTVFHLNNGTFETITIPESTNGCSDLAEICASPALVVIDLTTEYPETFDVFTMNNHCRGSGLGGWTRKRVLLSIGVKCPGTSLNYSGTLPTGEMMLAPTREIMSAERVQDIFPLPIYVYDYHKNEMKSIVIEGYGSQQSVMDSQENGMDDQLIKICYYEENIMSLDCLMSNQEQDKTTISN